MRTKRYLIGVLAAAAVLGACGGGGYSTDDLRNDLENSGEMTPESARCIADRVGETDIDVSKLDMKESSDALSAEDQEAFAKIFVDCAIEEYGGDLSIPDLSIPDLSVPGDDGGTEEPVPG